MCDSTISSLCVATSYRTWNNGKHVTDLSLWDAKFFWYRVSRQVFINVTRLFSRCIPTFQWYLLPPSSVWRGVDCSALKVEAVGFSTMWYIRVSVTVWYLRRLTHILTLGSQPVKSKWHVKRNLWYCPEVPLKFTLVLCKNKYMMPQFYSKKHLNIEVFVSFRTGLWKCNYGVIH